MTSPSSTAATVPITTTAQHHHSNSFSGTPEYGFSSTTGGTGRVGLIPPKQHVQYSSAPIGHNGNAHRDTQPLEVDEMGGLVGRKGSNATVDHAGYAGGASGGGGMAPIDEDGTASVGAGAAAGAGPRPSTATGAGEVRARPSFTGSVVGGGGAAAHHRRRPSASTTGANPQNRLTITNYSEREAEAVAAENAAMNAKRPGSSGGARRPRSAGGPNGHGGAAGHRGQWPTAEEEKKQLYENAVAKVHKVQGAAALAHTVSLSEVSDTADIRGLGS